LPEKLIKAIKKSERKAGKSAKEAERIAYATANKRGYMHGSKETAKGKAFDKKHGKG
jgi:hypothetical protein